jgi:hypothetical protein
MGRSVNRCIIRRKRTKRKNRKAISIRTRIRQRRRKSRGIRREIGRRRIKLIIGREIEKAMGKR